MLLGALPLVAWSAGSPPRTISPRSGTARPAVRAQGQRTFAELRRVVHDRVDEHDSTGIIAGIVLPDGRTRVVAYGRSGTGRRLDAQSVFEIGSITKVFTGTILGDMVQRGEVTLDEPLAALVPPGVTIPSRDGRQIELQDLATHTSGLPVDPLNLQPKDPERPYEDYTMVRLHDFLAHFTLTRGIGSQYEYSNVGAGLLGNALALRAGNSYERLVRERILSPLGMSMTAISPTPSMRRHLVAGHDGDGRRAPYFEIPALAAAGALRSTITDMLRFAASNLFGSGDAVLDRGMVLARTPRFTIDDTDRVGLHWFVIRVHGRQLVAHDGGTLGFRSSIVLDPARGTGVVVLSASATADGVDDIAMHAIDARLPLVRHRRTIALSRRVLARYAGVYRFPGFAIAISRSGSELRTRLGAGRLLRLHPRSRTVFISKTLPYAIRFHLARHGNVTGAVLLVDGEAGPRARKVT